MRFLVNMFQRTTKAKGIPQLTDYLASSPMFRNLVIGFHNNKTKAMDDIDGYLEKELLDKTGKSKKPTGQINSERSNSKNKRQ